MEHFRNRIGESSPRCSRIMWLSHLLTLAGGQSMRLIFLLLPWSWFWHEPGGPLFLRNAIRLPPAVLRAPTFLACKSLKCPGRKNM